MTLSSDFLELEFLSSLSKLIEINIKLKRNI